MANSNATTQTARYLVVVINHRENGLIVTYRAATLAEAKSLVAAEVKMLKRNSKGGFTQYRKVSEFNALGVANDTRRYGRLQVARDNNREVIIISRETLAETREAA